jgi:sialate O-acetylesterase
MVPNPVALRYAWATSPMGNLKLGGDQDIPYPNFRTDEWDLPESEDPAENPFTGAVARNGKADAQARLEARHLKEADMGRELRNRLNALSAPAE